MSNMKVCFGKNYGWTWNYFCREKHFFLFQITYVPQENIEVIRNTKIVHPQVITYFKSSKQSTKQISTFDWIFDQTKKSNIMLSSKNTYKCGWWFSGRRFFRTFRRVPIYPKALAQRNLPKRLKLVFVSLEVQILLKSVVSIL
jgi:hypothetical protein